MLERKLFLKNTVETYLYHQEFWLVLKLPLFADHDYLLNSMVLILYSFILKWYFLLQYF